MIFEGSDPDERVQALLATIRERIDELKALLADVNGKRLRTVRALRFQRGQGNERTCAAPWRIVESGRHAILEHVPCALNRR